MRGQWADLWMFILAGPFFIALFFGAAQFLWKLGRQMRWSYYRDLLPRKRGREPVCRRCGYILFFARYQRCPECGQSFRPGEIDPSYAEWDGEVLRPVEPQEEA